MKGCREKFVCQDVHMSLSGGFASDVMSGSDTACDTWQDGEGRECRFVSINKERKHNAVNFKRDFLLHAAEEILRFKVNDQVQAAGRSTRGWMVDVSQKKRAWPTAGEKRAWPTAGKKRT